MLVRNYKAFGIIFLFRIVFIYVHCVSEEDVLNLFKDYNLVKLNSYSTMNYIFVAKNLILIIVNLVLERLV